MAIKVNVGLGLGHVGPAAVIGKHTSCQRFTPDEVAEPIVVILPD